MVAGTKGNVMSNHQPRVPPLPESEWTPAIRDLLASRKIGGDVFNIFKTLARYPELMTRWLTFGAHILRQSLLPPRERELAILRVGWKCRAEYEWGHHVAIGKEAGLTDAEIARVAEGPDADGWTAFEAALLRGADELLDDTRLSDATWAALSARYDTRQMMDFIFTVGQYKLVSMALNSMGVQLEEGFKGFNDAA